ncbi:MAG: hypothetical protein SFU99_07360 [Saprospiraceae bacterium]|nr:hypothetical protein [Saprospiraceae bacterium]
MSYYKTINGIKYDAQLLKLAEKMTTDRGDGRISLEDAQTILKIAQDGPGITIIEKATLHYIRQHFHWTGAAAAWFEEQFAQSELFDLQELIQSAKLIFQLPGLEFDIDEKEVKLQSQLPNNHVTFEQALNTGLASFLFDANDLESPRNLVMEVHQIFRKNFASEEDWNEALTDKVQAYLNEGGRFRLLPVSLPANEDDLDFNPPENGETMRDNWVFYLYLDTLSDHGHWAIIDRTGAKPAYNYGFN